MHWLSDNGPFQIWNSSKFTKKHVYSSITHRYFIFSLQSSLFLSQVLPAWRPSTFYQIPDRFQIKPVHCPQVHIAQKLILLKGGGMRGGLLHETTKVKKNFYLKYVVKVLVLISVSVLRSPTSNSSSWKSFHVRPGSGLSLLSATPWRVGTNVDNKKKRSIVYFSTFGPCLICLFDNKNRRSILSLICVFDNCIWPACLDLANGGKNLRSFFTGSWLTDYLHFHGLLSFILKIMLLGQLSHGD